MLNQEIGYIKINKFSSHTYSEFMTALHSLKKKGLKKLILDLRDNGGGVLEEAIDIADEFLEGDKLITYTEGAHMPKKEYRCRRLGQFEEGKLIVLSNEGSASASEVLMGALQDWDRATIIGSRSFGKGLVQEQFDLSDHSAVRLTIARYFSPTGRCIQRSYANGEKAYYDEIETDSTSRSFNDSSKTFTTPKGKKVYGGGGISPDIVMTEDNKRFTNLVATLFNKGTLNHFSYDYYRQQINVLKNYTTPLKFISEYSIPQSAWNSFIIYSNKDSVDIKNISNDEKQVVLKSIKNFIGRNHFSKNDYFEVLMNDDQEIKKSLELFK
jgi:carboxyl-terminal processing protease